MHKRIPARVNSHPRFWLWATIGVLALAVVVLPYNAANLNQNASLERCRAASEGARFTAAALQAIIDGNQDVADDPFQSAKTRLARRSENARLRPAVDYYDERAVLDCEEAFPEPPFPF